MKRRLFIFALVLSLLAGTLSGCGKNANVKAVEAMISAIGEVTLESEEAILEAEEAVSALSSADRGELSNYEDLRSMRSELNVLKAEEVDGLIKAIGSNVTLESEEAVKAAREAYDALTKDMKLLVGKLSDLEAAEKTLKRLKEEGGESSEDSEPEEESSSKPEEESSSKPEESSSKPEEESSSKPEESSSKPEEESSKPEESSSKPEEESSSKPEEESSSSGQTSQEKINACNEAIASIKRDRLNLYDLSTVEAAITAYNVLTDAEKDALDNEYSFYLCLYELDLYGATMDNGYLARAGYTHERATVEEAKAALWLYGVSYDMDDDGGITIFMEYENMSSKTIDRISFIVMIMDSDNYPVLSVSSSGSGPYLSWFLHDYDRESGYYDPGEEGWGPFYGSAGENAGDGFTLFAIEISYEDGSFLRIANDTLLSIYGADGP